MTRIKIAIDGGDYGFTSCFAEQDYHGSYSLSEVEFADYLAVCEKYQAWQDKLRALKPDDYVAPPKPPKLTKEEVAIRTAWYKSQREENLEAFLDLVCPLPGAK